MTPGFDSIDNHLKEAGDFARAAMPMGMLLAWCANLQLLSHEVLMEHEKLLIRVRFQEAQGSELLIACGGDLQRCLFNSQGQQFLDRYYSRFMSDFRAIFPGDYYAVEDNWENYQPVAAMLTQAYMGDKPALQPGDGVVTRLLQGVRNLWH
ncbi:MAG: hypothetical protein GXP16_00585 [Gammaproteobacteria bacterium]|nr:hypothetical protein [Gammaproteobacteria bacterium]